MNFSSEKHISANWNTRIKIKRIIFENKVVNKIKDTQATSLDFNINDIYLISYTKRNILFQFRNLLINN